MGIKGLHSAIKHLKSPTHLVELPDIRRVAVDASSFMIKGGVGYARDYYLGTLERMPWAEYCLDLAIMLHEHGIEPLFVFDGQRLPIKEETCTHRRESREKAKHDAEILEAHGMIDDAEKKWQQAFVLEQHMETETLDMLVTNNVVCYTSRYESDQCMASLWKQGIVDAVVTEDSDLIAYGVKRCIFKLKSDGHCEYYGASTEGAPEPKKRRVDVMLPSLNDEQIAQLCVLSGTDYNENIRGVGIKKVYTMIMQNSWTEIVQALSICGTLLDKMTQALDVFMHPEHFANPKFVSIQDICMQFM